MNSRCQMLSQSDRMKFVCDGFATLHAAASTLDASTSSRTSSFFVVTSFCAQRWNTKRCMNLFHCYRTRVNITSRHDCNIKTIQFMHANLHRFSNRPLTWAQQNVHWKKRPLSLKIARGNKGKKTLFSPWKLQEVLRVVTFKIKTSRKFPHQKLAVGDINSFLSGIIFGTNREISKMKTKKKKKRRPNKRKSNSQKSRESIIHELDMLLQGIDGTATATKKHPNKKPKNTHKKPKRVCFVWISMYIYVLGKFRCLSNHDTSTNSTHKIPQ